MAIANRTLFASTALLLAVGFLTLMGLVGASLWLSERAQLYVTEVIGIRDRRSAAAELRSALQAAESSQRGFLATGNEIYLAPFDSAKTLALTQLDKLARSVARNPDRTDMMKRLASVIDEKIGEMNQTIASKNARRVSEAIALLKTNRGKALMDEANVFLSAVMISADEELTAGVNQQQANARLLRSTSVVGNIVVILVVAGVTVLLVRYTREISAVREEVETLNFTLEERVKERTADLVAAREHAEILLTEVNHRVANSLTLLASMVKLQSNAAKDQASKTALAETQGRILAISLIHRKLYTSDDVRFVALDDYLSGLVEHLETTLRAEGHSAVLKHKFESLTMRTDRSVNLGVIATEWITNAFKYAYPDRSGEIRVSLTRDSEGRAKLTVEDDGVGYPPTSESPKGTGLGSRIVSAMASTVAGKVSFERREPGTAAILVFPI